MLGNDAAELAGFKRSINLTEYAASTGYELDKRESSRNSAVMRHLTAIKSLSPGKRITGFILAFGMIRITAASLIL